MTVSAIGNRSRGLAAPLLLALTISFGASAAEEATVRFGAPRNLATVIGDTIIEVSVYAPDGVEVREVTLTVDGEPLAVLTRPPWRVEWDAGDATRGHRLEAVAILSDGSVAEGSVRTSALRINQVEEVGLVNLYPVVSDGGGHYVTDLENKDFRILENGVPQKISRFTTERRPLRVGIVLDTSLSMAKGNRLVHAQKAALGFLRIFSDEDECMVVTFSDAVHTAQAFTSDVTALGDAILATEAHGGTALYDAIWRTSKQLEAFNGRRVMIVLSDGRDEATSGFEPGSLHTLEEALDRAVRSEVMLFAIGLGQNLDRECARPWATRARSGRGCAQGESLQEILTKLAESTGGRLLLSSGAGRLRRAFEQVAEDLRHQYSIAYKSSDDKDDGAWRDIRVLIPGHDFEIVVRKGYYASVPQNAGQPGSTAR